MAQFSFTCRFCGGESGFARRAAATQAEATPNPYANQVRKYRCELCSRINDVERSGYDWTRIEQAASG